VSVQARVLELFGELQERFGFATLFITHDLAVVDLLAHRVVVLHRAHRRGGPTARVLGDPQDAYTRKLIASLPVPDPDAQAARRRTGATGRD
jgi:peptide/nickel transport system ATP-binding protein